jgi:arabinose-5-phosphate isomerase
MTEPRSPQDRARRVLTEEADAVRLLAQRLDAAFDAACAQILECRGRVVVTGMGKSGIVGRKIAATLASTGTPSLFLHPAEALHGDLGMITEADVVLALSYSGETDELLAILPAVKHRAAALIGVTGSVRSSLGEAADVVLDVCVPREACLHNLAPTTSTTVMMALGDALAVALMELRGFRKEDYALLHPAGSLGRRLLLRVADVMRTGDQVAVVREDASVQEALFAITKAGAGLACVVNGDGQLVGVLSDGDTRRFLTKVGGEALYRAVSEAMTRGPRTTTEHRLAVEALDRFEHDAVKLGDLVVVDAGNRPVGILTLKDLVRAGIVLPESA